MATHASVLQVFNSSMAAYSKANPVHRQNLMNMLLHSADVGNPTLKFDLAKKWSYCIIDEFAEQVSSEIKMGLPITEFMQIAGNLEKIRNNQTGFIDFLVLPLFKAIDVHFPQLKEYTSTAEANREIWRSLTTL